MPSVPPEFINVPAKFEILAEFTVISVMPFILLFEFVMLFCALSKTEVLLLMPEFVVDTLLCAVMLT